jgi:streptogramin lyase
MAATASAEGPGELGHPEGIAVDSHGDVWISNTYRASVDEFNGTGEYIKTIGSEGSGPGQLEEPEGLAVDSSGNVWVTDWSNDRVEEYDEAGEYVRRFGWSRTRIRHRRQSHRGVR